MSPEIENRGISGPTKMTYVLQTFFLRKELSVLILIYHVKLYLGLQMAVAPLSYQPSKHIHQIDHWEEK